MFSSSVTGAGSICLGCQLRAVTRRAAPILAASAGGHTPTPIRRRRYASDSSEPASSNDDFLTTVLSEQRHDDSYEVPKPKKKKAPAHRVKSKKQRDAFADTFNGQIHREPSPFISGHDVGFEDVWDQDPELAKGKTEPEDTLGKSDGKAEPAPVEHESDEIDYGSSTPEADLYLANYSWNRLSASELRQQYADRKYRPPKKTQPQPQEEPAAPVRDVSKKSRTKPQDQRAEKIPTLGESMPRKSREKHTDNLYDWGQADSSDIQHHSDTVFDLGEGTATALQEPQDDIGYDWGEGTLTQSQEPHMEEPEDVAIEEPKEPIIRHYRKGDTRLVEDLPQLPVETLGQDASVIVLREQGLWKRRQFKEESGPADSGLRIQDHVDQEQGLSLDIILENIDGLQPEHRILPARDFKDIFDILMQGFTTMHLETYINRHRQRLAEGDETPFLGVIPDEIISRPWIVSQSRWIPDVMGAVADVADPLKGYILKTMPPKQRLVMQLMRECWGMSVQELLYGQGILDLEVRDLEFRLLTCRFRLSTQALVRYLLLILDDRSGSSALPAAHLTSAPRPGRRPGHQGHQIAENTPNSCSKSRR